MVPEEWIQVHVGGYKQWKGGRCGKPEVLTANGTGPHVAQMSLIKESHCPMLASGGHTSWISRATFLTGTWSAFPQLDLVDQSSGCPSFWPGTFRRFPGDAAGPKQQRMQGTPRWCWWTKVARDSGDWIFWTLMNKNNERILVPYIQNQMPAATSFSFWTRGQRPVN